MIIVNSFLYQLLKISFILVFMLVGISTSYSQDEKTKSEISEAINNVVTGNITQAIPVLKKYAEVQNFDEFTKLKINIYLNWYYFSTNDKALNTEKINTLTDSYLERNKNSKSVGLNSEDEILALFFASVINGGIGNNKKMISYLLIIKNSYDLKNINKENWLYTEVLRLLTRGYYYSEDYKSAIEFGLIAIKFNGETNQETNGSLLEVLDLLYLSYNNLDNPQKALEYLKKAVEFGKEFWGESHPNYLTNLNNLATFYLKFGDYKQALTINKYVVEKRKVILGEKHPDYLTSLSNLAVIYSILGNYQQALKIDQQILVRRKEDYGELHPDYLTSLNNLATSYLKFGDYNQALEINKQVVEKRKVILGETHPNYLNSLHNLAYIYTSLGDYQKALETIQQVLDRRKEILGESHPDYLTSLSVLAITLTKLGDHQKALAINQKIVELRKEVLGEKHPSYQISLNNLATYYFELGEYQKALEIIQQVLEFQKEVLGEYHPDYINTLNNLSRCYSELGNYQFALEIIQMAVDLGKDVFGESHPDYLKSVSSQAYYYILLEDFESAFEIYLEIVKLNEEFLGIMHPDYIQTLSNLSISEFYLKKNDLALFHFTQSLNLEQEKIWEYFGQLTEYQRENFWAQSSNSFDLFPMFLENASISNPEPISFAYDIALFTKGLLLNTTLDFDQLLAEKGTPEAIEKYKDLKLFKLQIQRLYEKPIAERYLNVDSLETVAQKLETELVKLSKEYGDYTQNLKITWKDVQTKLGEKDIAIEFLEYPTLTDTVKYAALILRKGLENPKFVPLFRKDLIDEFIKRDPNQIYSNGFIGKEIRKLVWNPLEEFISPGDNVYFSAAGMLHQLAVENLSFDDSTTLGDRYQMFRLSSTKELALKKPESNNQSVALYGGIKYDLELDQMIAGSKKYEQKDNYLSVRGIDQDTIARKGWQFLPGTLAEANEVSQILNKNRYQISEYIGETGSEESFKDLSGKRTGIIHIATHGFFLPVEQSERNPFIQMRFDGQNDNARYVDPMLRSGLLLAGGNRAWQGDSIPNTIEDGVLTAKEISHLDLRETDLVVLSACETGLGDVSSEGVFGLQRAFKQAGAHTLIMSLWNVKDEATQYLMTNFYSYLTQGASKREAFIQARNKCRERYPDPASWAAFIMLD